MTAMKRLNGKYVAVVAIAVLVLTSIVLLASGLNRQNAVAQKAPNAGSRQMRSDSGGGVTIDVTWMADIQGALVFNVAMDTHSVDLDGYDFKQQAVLRDDQGKQYAPTSWDSGPGGHHRSGVLTFPVPASVNSGNTAYFEVIIRGVAGVAERVLRWDQ